MHPDLYLSESCGKRRLRIRPIVGECEVLTNLNMFFSVVDPKLFFSDPDPTFQEISDPDPISDPTYPRIRVGTEGAPNRTRPILLLMCHFFLTQIAGGFFSTP